MPTTVTDAIRLIQELAAELERYQDTDRITRGRLAAAGAPTTLSAMRGQPSDGPDRETDLPERVGWLIEQVRPRAVTDTDAIDRVMKAQNTLVTVLTDHSAFSHIDHARRVAVAIDRLIDAKIAAGR